MSLHHLQVLMILLAKFFPLTIQTFFLDLNKSSLGVCDDLPHGQRS